MQRILLTIPGDPLPKQRPRFNGHRAYTQKSTRDFEERVGWKAKVAVRKPLTGALVLELTFFRRTRRRVDVDNLVKRPKKWRKMAGNGVI